MTGSFHMCKFEIIEQCTLTRDGSRAVGRRIISRCKECGRIKNKDIV